jgi:uncharacterized protein YdeI (YjbR/CyaY-like superfamily)
MKPRFFATPATFRKWLEKNHQTAKELIVGFYKKASGRESIDWPQSVDEALCFGWIDGVRHNLDEISYSIRFTPRKPRSHWSAVNVKRVAELTRLGLMQPAGQAAFALRDEANTARHSYEREHAELGEEYEKKFRAHEKAWAYFEAQPPWYRKTTSWYVVSARREDTRQKRLNTLMEHSAKGEWLPGLVRTPRS